ncbi:sugar kinase [Microbacterium sp.]|uniref:sugar kinase n=1 Tax=Microbacterium sp. TaxID=51671 RepID=UPI0039E2E6D3
MTRALVTLGETMGLFHADQPGAAAHVDGFRFGIGGAESNVAIGVARLGGRARWIGRVGDDGVGGRICRELRAEQVDVRAVVDADAPSGIMVKTRRGGRVIVDYHRTGSAGSRLTAADLADESLWTDVGVLHVTGITPALSEAAHEAVFAAVEIARARGARISFDVNHRSSLWGTTHAGRARAAASYRELLSVSHLVFAGEDEARLLATGAAPDASAADLARALGESGADVVVKRGERGAFARIDGREYDLPAVPIAPIDTVGAGDAFVAGYLADTLSGADAPQSLRTALRAGAFACLHPGDWEGLPHRSDLDLLEATDPVVR